MVWTWKTASDGFVSLISHVQKLFDITNKVNGYKRSTAQTRTLLIPRGWHTRTVSLLRKWLKVNANWRGTTLIGPYILVNHSSYFLDDTIHVFSITYTDCDILLFGIDCITTHVHLYAVLLERKSIASWKSVVLEIIDVTCYCMQNVSQCYVEELAWYQKFMMFGEF